MLYLLSKAVYACTRKESLALRAATLITLIAGFFVALNAYYAATEEVPANGGSFTEGIVGQPTFINPLISSGSDADMAAIELLFPRLRDIIESRTKSTDRKTLSITLKKDLAWDDGSPLTADDILFTVETAQDILIRSSQAGAWQGVIAEKTNDNEIRFTLREPSAFFETTMEGLKIAPRHIFGAVPAANLRLSAYNLEPVGAGPWMFNTMSTERNGFITELSLVRNPRYAGTLPHIAEFSLRFYPDTESAVRAFNKKEIDGLGGISPDEAAAIPVEHRLITASLPRYYAAFFNQNTHPALKDKSVRQALAASIDRSKITRDVFRGHAAASLGPIPPQTEGYDATLFALAPKTAEDSKRLLDEAGWLINPEDGIRYKSIGKERVRLGFTVLVPNLPFLARTMDIVKANWRAIGIDADMISMSVDDMQKGPIKTRNYEIIVFGNVLKGNPDISAFWHSSQKFYPGLNLSMYENKAVDIILTATQKAEQPDIAQLKKAQEIIQSDAPAAFLINPNYLYAIPANLHGLDPKEFVTPSDRLGKTESWYIRTKRQFKKRAAPEATLAQKGI